MVLFQEVLPAELLDLLVLTLCRQAPAFAMSLGYAKLVTAVLTVYQSQVSRTLGPADLAAGAAADRGPGAGPWVSWQWSSQSSLLRFVPGHPSPPEQPGCCSESEQRSSEEIAAGCAGRSEVRLVLHSWGWAGLFLMEDGSLQAPSLPWVVGNP